MALEIPRTIVFCFLSLTIAMGQTLKAQPSYDETMARQRAGEQAIQDNWEQGAIVAAESDYEESQKSYSPPPPQFAESYMSVAWNFNSSEVWATSGHRTGAQAEKVVLDACNNVMGDGCMIGAQWVNSSFIAVAHDEFGIPWIKGGANKKSAAEANALSYCRENSINCKITKVFGSTLIPLSTSAAVDLSKNFFPSGRIKRHSFALVAWPQKEPSANWRNTAWISAGESDWSKARKQLISKCAADTGTPCAVTSTAVNGVLVRYLDQKRQKFWISAKSPQSAPIRVKQLCQKGAHCWIIDWVDSNAKQFSTIDQNKVGPTGRGYYSLAWTSGWPQMAVVTGRKSNAKAIADAMALCAAQSGKKCEPFLDKPDLAQGKFLAVFKDSGGSMRAHVGFSHEELDYRAKESCDAAKVKCTRRLLLDLTSISAQTFAM